MAKKKKMTKAQAAAARKEVTPQMVAKARSHQELENIRATQQRVQKEQSKPHLFPLIMGGIVVIAIVAFAWILTAGPGAIIG